MRIALVALVAAYAVACAPSGDRRAPDGAAPPTAPPEQAPPRVRDRDPADHLERDPITQLSAGRLPATFTARIGAVDAEIRFAPREDPSAFRRTVAFARLAEALGTARTRAAAWRRVGLAEVVPLLAPDARVELARRATVLADGTMDALVLAPGPLRGAWTAPIAGRPVALDGSVEATIWRRWAASPEPVPGERPAIVRAWVEVLVLDYLAADAQRRTVLFDEAADALWLDEPPGTSGAFPLHVEAGGLDHQLLELREIARFPAELVERLRAFDEAAARRALAPGGFSTWLLPPRALVELDERRETVLSLVDARASIR